MRAGVAILAGILSIGAAQAQTVLRPVPPGIIVASDLDGPYEYDAGPPVEAPPPRYAPRPYPPLDDGPPPPAYRPPPYGPTAYAPPVLPIPEIYRIVRENGYSPLGAPQQRGFVFTIGVLDPDGEDGRLVIDARSGRIVRFVPAYRFGRRSTEDFNVAYGPPSALPQVALPRPVVQARASVPLPKPRAAGKSLPESTAALGAQQAVRIPPAPTAAVAAAPVIAPPAVKPAVTVQPTQAMPPAQGVD